MNVYTHVDVAALADDIDSLPALNGPTAEDMPSAQDKPVLASSIPAELVDLADNWDSLPERIRAAISSLAGA